MKTVFRCKSLFIGLGLFFALLNAQPTDPCNRIGYAGLGGPCYAGIGGAAYAGIGDPAYAGIGGACYAGIGGKAYKVCTGCLLLPVASTLLLPGVRNLEVQVKKLLGAKLKSFYLYACRSFFYAPDETRLRLTPSLKLKYRKPRWQE